MISRRAALLTVCLVACLLSGCLDQGGSGGDKDSVKLYQHDLIVKITNPRPGNILSGNEKVTFDSQVSGGDGRYSYSWSSNLNGQISTSKSFSISPSRLKKGEHNIIVKVRDSAGATGQGSVLIRVM